MTARQRSQKTRPLLFVDALETKGAAAAARRFMMNERRLRVAHGAPAARGEAQAQIDVVQFDGKRHVVEAADRVEFPSLDHQAGARYGGDLMRQEIAFEPAGRVLMQAGAEMAGDPAHAEQHADTPGCALGIEQLRAHSADIGLDREIEEFSIQSGVTTRVSLLRKTSSRRAPPARQRCTAPRN